MQLIKAEKEHISELVRISRAAFDSDTAVGTDTPGGPPGYDSVSWHMQMMEDGHLLAAVEEGEAKGIVGGTIIFPDEKNLLMYIGRIFVNPKLFRRGYGTRIMEGLEELYPGYSVWRLDTPAWNRRTNSFYPRLGYVETHRDGGCVYYQKVNQTIIPAESGRMAIPAMKARAFIVNPHASGCTTLHESRGLTMNDAHKPLRACGLAHSCLAE